MAETPFRRRWVQTASLSSISFRRSSSSSGNSRPFQTCRPKNAQNRFQLVFRRFLAAFARPEHPLALFLDDLQWLDAATLELLEHLITDPDVQYLHAGRGLPRQRSQFVSPAHADAGGDSQRRSANAGDRAGATRARGCRPARRGCPALREPRLLILWRSWCTRRPAAIRSSRSSSSRRWPRKGCSDSTRMQQPGSGTWLGFDAKGYTDNVVDLMVGKLKRLSEHDARRTQATRLSGERGRIRHSHSGSRRIRRGDPHGALGRPSAPG